MTASTIALRVEELRRRAEALTSELDDWLGRVRTPGQLDLDVHASQLNAIDILVRESLARQKALLANPPADGAGLGNWSPGLGQQIARGQKVWDYFRDKLELRFSPRFREPLWLADTIAFECHRPVVTAAAHLHGLGHPQELREPPLTYLDAEGSARTWTRGDHPKSGNDLVLGNAKLPIPLISLPWDTVGNLWELVSIAHEVGHDLEADLKARPAMEQALAKAAAIPAARMPQWKVWQAEILADLIALQLVGPAFLDGLLHLLLLPRDEVMIIGPGPHPVPYLRMRLGLTHARKLIDPAPPALTAHLDDIEATWNALYPNPPAALAEWIEDVPQVRSALADAPLKANGPTWRTLIPYTAKNDEDVRAAAAFLGTGQQKPGQMNARYVVAAARIAAGEAARSPATLAASLVSVQKEAAALVREFATPGARAGDGNDRHRKFIASFLDEVPA